MITTRFVLFTNVFATVKKEKEKTRQNDLQGQLSLNNSNHRKSTHASTSNEKLSHQR